MSELYERFVGTAKREATRSEVAKDRDRVIHSSAFRRLQGKSQVFGVHTSDFFRTRLTHSIECAQIGRAIAKRVDTGWEEVVEERADFPDLVEVACLAHDLGHPPFGHNGEVALRQAMERRSHSLFEGNAQSFRIVTLIEPKSIGPVAPDIDRWVGLNLTRASLKAITKYPWVETSEMRNQPHPKFSVYRDEADEAYFEWLWDGDMAKASKTLATRIMDAADDITYATHDFEDGVWSGMIPTYKLFTDAPDEAALGQIVEKLSERYDDINQDRAAEALQRLRDAAVWEARLAPEQLDWMRTPFERTRQNVAYLKRFTAALIGLLIDAVTPDGAFADPRADIRLQIDVLTAIAWIWMIERSDLATTQYGQRRLIDQLFEAYFEERLALPRREEVRDLEGELLPDGTWPQLARLICDHVAGMTDDYALAAHEAMFGGQAGIKLGYAY